MADAGIVAIGFSRTPSGNSEDMGPPRDVIVWEGSSFLREPHMTLVDSVNGEVRIRIKRGFGSRST